MLQYEHIVAINDLTNPFAVVLTREQLWRGLMLRVESPDLFLPNVDEVEFLEKTGDKWVRQMMLGNLHVLDHIFLQHQEQIRFDTQANKAHPGGSLVITILEPEPNELFVRFNYKKPSDIDPDEAKLADYLFKMWQQVDLDALRLIRTLIEQDKI